MRSRVSSTLCILVTVVLLLAAVPAARGEVPDASEGVLEATEVTEVVILPVETPADDPILDVVARAVADTLRLNLALLPRIEVREVSERAIGEREPAVPPRFSSSVLDDLVGALDLVGHENLLRLRVERDTQGLITVAVEAYALALEEVTITDEVRAERLIEVFDAADTLTDAVIVGFAGREVAYGSLAVVNEGAPGEFALYLNGQELGRDGPDERPIVAGEYRLEVRQERLLGAETVYSASVTVEPERATEVRFALPRLTESEYRRFGELDAEVRALWRNEDYEAAAERLEGAIAELESASPAGGEAAGAGYADLAARYTLMLETLSEERATAGAPARGAVSHAVGAPHAVSRVSARRVDFPDLSEKLALEAEPFSQRIARYRYVPYRPPEPGEEFPDWELVEPALTAREHNMRRLNFSDSRMSLFVQRVYLAHDDNKIYMRFELSGGLDDDATIRAESEPSYTVAFGNLGLHHGWVRNRWVTQLAELSTDNRMPERRIASGNVRTDGRSFEASFPLDEIERVLDGPGLRMLEVYTHTRDSTRSPAVFRRHHYLTRLIRF